MEWEINPEEYRYILGDFIRSGINIKYENEKLTCVTGSSLATFDLKDKRVDDAWDYEIERFISQIDHQ